MYIFALLNKRVLKAIYVWKVRVFNKISVKLKRIITH